MWLRPTSSPWAPSCRYGQQWSRSPISPCCCSWRTVWRLPPSSCRTTARFTPSSPIRGKTRRLCTIEIFLKENLLRCISEGIGNRARFLPRYHSSALTLYLQSFKMPVSNQVRRNESVLSFFPSKYWNVFCAAQVYIHCNLIVWDPEGLSEDKKACNYIEQTKR